MKDYKHYTIMGAVQERMNIFTIRVPRGKDTAFLRGVVRHMGWETTITEPRKKCGLDLALEDVKAGRVHSFDNVEDAIKWLND